LKKIVCQVALAIVVMESPALAQEKRVDVSVPSGWTFADGVDGLGGRDVERGLRSDFDAPWPGRRQWQCH
jgi:hypothetical protein